MATHSLISPNDSVCSFDVTDAGVTITDTVCGVLCCEPYTLPVAEARELYRILLDQDWSVTN